MNRLIVVLGATATGKSSVAVSLAKALSSEIISADSMQIFKQMPIGTACPSFEEQQGICHHMMAFLEPNIQYSVSEYQKNAVSLIEEISLRGKIPILCGGTGLYINSITYDLDFTKTSANDALRKELSDAYDADKNALYDRLLSMDPDAAARIHLNDKKRVIRRIEILTLGEKEEYDFCRQNTSLDLMIFGLYKERSVLYKDIEKRVDLMMQQGLLEEVKTLYDTYGEKIPAFTAIGYKEFLPYLKGEESLEKAVETVKQNTRRFAKRQITWFKRDPRIHWIEYHENCFLEILTYMKEKTEK